MSSQVRSARFPMTGVLDVGINNAGDVAFLAQLAPNVFGILTGPDPVADKVIRDGDALFGSTVTMLQKRYDNRRPERRGPDRLPLLAGQRAQRHRPGHAHSASSPAITTATTASTRPTTFCGATTFSHCPIMKS